MKYLIALFSSLLFTLSVIGQPDTLFLTFEQKKTFESILDSFQQRQMDVDQIYRENKRFKSLMRTIDKMDGSKDFSYNVKDSLYQQAETIYPNNVQISYWKNPNGCYFGTDLIEKTQARLSDYLSLCSRLRSNEFEISEDEFSQLHSENMNIFLTLLRRALFLIDKNLEGRLWGHLYFAELEKAHILILSDKK